MSRVVAVSWPAKSPEDPITDNEAKYPDLRGHLAQVFVTHYAKTHFLVDFRENVGKVQKKNGGEVSFIGVFPAGDLTHVDPQKGGE